MNREEFLMSCAQQLKTDKIGHGYISEYAKYLPEKINAMLEIGVLKGASAIMFDLFYKRKPDIHLIDLFGEEGNMTPRECRRFEFIPHKGSQSDLDFIASIKDKLDLIIDDGSHIASDQLISFKHFFMNNLTSGGQYYIEDTHCNLTEFWWGGEVKRFEDTALWMFDNYIKTGEIINPYFNEGEQEVYKNLISDVKILADRKLILINRN